VVERKHPLAECERCPLAKRDCAPTTGPEDAKVVVVSRSPGRYDAERRRPFSGPSGQVLDHLLDMNGYSRDTVKVTNIVLCESNDPPKEAIDACKARLVADCESADTIIAAGAEAASILAKSTVNKGRQLIHERFTMKFKPQRVIVTFNPVMVIRDADHFPSIVEDFKLALAPPPPITYPTVKICDNRRSVLASLKRLRGANLVGVDIEGFNPHIECLGVAADSSTVDVYTRTGVERCMAEIGEYLALPNIDFTWHNGIYDVKVLKNNNIAAYIGQDTLAMSCILDERPGMHALGYLARLELGWPNYEPESVEKYKDTGVLPDDMEEFYTYNAYDVSATMQLYDLLVQRLDDATRKGYSEQLIPFFNALTNIERRGFIYDAVRAADLNEEVVLPKLRSLRAELAKIAGLDFYNPMSSPQTKAIVYERWELKHGLRDKGKVKKSTSFDKDVRREILEGRFECTPRAREKMVQFASTYHVFRSIETQRGTFIEGLIKQTKTDSKLYTEINPYGTVNGRTSSRKPNFQNITKEARDVVPGIRTLFLPSPGNVIVQADYSQAELRSIAKLSGDKELLAIYKNSKRSLHKETALAFYGPDYTPTQYTTSKNINFGVCYLQGAASFAQLYLMPVEEAQAYIDNWWIKFPRIKEWTDEIIAIVEQEQELTSPFGFKRRFQLITQENLHDVHREGVNFLPSNIAAQLTIASVSELDALGIPVINTVHDSIICDVPRGEAESVARTMKEVMERMPITTIGWDDIPFKADISIGETWGDVEEIEL
jgi:uracil-DNA glycosylase family 4